MFNLFLRSACVRSSHCFVWFELSSQAGLAVPEPQKNVRGELVVLQNSSHLHRVVQKKYSWWPGKSWDWFGRKRRKYRQHCPTSQVHPWQDLLWNRLQIMICSFKSEHVVQIAIILINSQACWDNRVCCNQYEHQLKCSEREIYQSHQHHNSLGTWTTDHFMQCGEFIARMDNSLKTFSHKAYESRSVIPKKNMRWIQKIYIPFYLIAF